MFVVFVGGILGSVNCGSFRVIILVEVSVDVLLFDELCKFMDFINLSRVKYYIAPET